MLLFRYDITPTSNKLYQFVRKGAMSAPGKGAGQIVRGPAQEGACRNRPSDMPPELKAGAAEAIAEW